MLGVDKGIIRKMRQIQKQNLAMSSRHMETVHISGCLVYDRWQIIYNNNPLFLPKIYFYARSHNFQMQLLVLSCTSMCPLGPRNKSAVTGGCYEYLYLEVMSGRKWPAIVV